MESRQDPASHAADALPLPGGIAIHARPIDIRPPEVGTTALHEARAGTLWALGVWRSLVARSVRVGEVPSSNLGTPIEGGGTPGSPADPSFSAWHG